MGKASTVAKSIVRPILVNGAGLSGLSAALSLRKAGLDVELTDLAPDLKHRGGIGVLLGPAAMRVFHRMGIHERIQEAGHVVNTVHYTNQEGRDFSTLDVASLGEEFDTSCVSIRSSSLHRLLMEAAIDAGCYMQLGTGITKMRPKGDDLLQVKFSKGKKISNYQAVVGADGVSSMTRGLMKIGDPIYKFPGYGAWEVLVTKANNICPPEPLEMIGDERMLRVLPVGGGIFTLWGVKKEEKPSPRKVVNHKTQFEDFFKYFEDFSHVLPDVESHIKETASIKFNYSSAHAVNARWASNRCVLVGDAAHAMLPCTIQGEAMAVEDGYTLAQEIMQDDVPFEDRLYRWEAKRLARVGPIQQAAWDRSKEILGSMKNFVPPSMRTRLLGLSRMSSRTLKKECRDVLLDGIE